MQEAFSDETLMNFALGVPLQRIKWPKLEALGIEVIVRRDDLVHTRLSGNKFYKLFYNLQKAVGKTLLSFGGAYSNHIHALAAAGNEYGFNTVGIIRGERPKQLSPTLVDALAWGMRLHFVSRKVYQQKESIAFINQLYDQFGDIYIVPEGGANLLGVKGCQAIVKATESRESFDAICLACGTGSTLAGVASALNPDKKAYGISVLKGYDCLSDDVASFMRRVLISQGREDFVAEKLKLKHKGTEEGCVGIGKQSSPEYQNWEVVSRFHGGGYAKLSDELLTFINRFESHASFVIEPVYTAKLFWAIETMACEGLWSRGTRLVAVHSGGLQGRRGFTMKQLSV
ncbi:hypothetical protein AB835_06855 [Candidatus Endobugula sertula]|uniref:Tryptophan synthase beta chain-like PALP domain-containing protein n=1 Tax=Candidatus Endobugula sertula TaxID=62101 RepID=A0A1D2QQL5_9GAMM|nr:hypothetical protein AB835_06855 [Candidatus Endobugula sertula]